MATPAKYDTTPRVVTDTPEMARRRQLRAYREEREAYARFLLDNDPDVHDLKQARRAADEALQQQRDVAKGNLDPETGEPTRRARRSRRQQDRPRARKSPSSRARTSSRPRRASGRRPSFTSKTARTVVAPFGSAASAGWTLFQGGLSLLLLYMVLQNAGAIGAFTDGIVAGFRRLADPRTPLIPTRGESSPPRPKLRVVRGGRPSGYSSGGLPGPGSPQFVKAQRGR